MKILLFLFVFSSVSSAQSLEPGLWRAHSVFNVSGFSFPPSDDEECISKADAKDARTTIAKKLRNDGCEITSWKVKKNHLEAGLKCKNSEIDATGKIHGDFSAKSYDLTGEAAGVFKQVIETTANLKLKGQWTKTCKK